MAPKSPEFTHQSPPKYILHSDVLGSLPVFDDVEMKEEGEVTKSEIVQESQQAKKPRSKKSLKTLEPSPILYSPSTTSNFPPSVYSPKPKESLEVPKPKVLPQDLPFSPKPKSLLTNLLDKINKKSVEKLVSYDEI
jgi:hypothetical protein